MLEGKKHFWQCKSISDRSFQVLLFKKHFYFAFIFLKNIFTGYRRLGGKTSGCCFLLNTLKMLFHCFLSYKVLPRNPWSILSLRLYSDPFYVRGQKQCVFLAALKFFSLFLDFSYLIMMCLGEISCAFITSGTLYNSQIYEFIVFTELDKILAIIYPHIFLLLPQHTHFS